MGYSATTDAGRLFSGALSSAAVQDYFMELPKKYLFWSFLTYSMIPEGFVLPSVSPTRLLQYSLPRKAPNSGFLIRHCWFILCQTRWRRASNGKIIVEGISPLLEGIVNLWRRVLAMYLLLQLGVEWQVLSFPCCYPRDVGNGRRFFRVGRVFRFFRVRSGRSVLSVQRTYKGWRNDILFLGTEITEFAQTRNTLAIWKTNPETNSCTIRWHQTQRFPERLTKLVISSWQIQHVVPISMFPSSLHVKLQSHLNQRCWIWLFVEDNCLQWNSDRPIHCSWINDPQ